MVAGQSRCARLEITFFRLLYHKPHFSFLCMALEEGTRIIFIELYTRTSKIGYVIAFNGSQGWTSWSRKLKVQLQFRSWTRAKGKHERIIAAKCSGTATTRARYRTIARQILGTVNNSVTMGGPLRYVRSDVHRCKVVAPRYYIVYPRGWLFLKHTQDGTDSTPKNCYVRARTIRVRKSWKKKDAYFSGGTIESKARSKLGSKKGKLASCKLGSSVASSRDIELPRRPSVWRIQLSGTTARSLALIPKFVFQSKGILRVFVLRSSPRRGGRRFTMILIAISRRGRRQIDRDKSLIKSNFIFTID